MNIISEMSSVIIVNPLTSQLCDTLSYQVVSVTCSISSNFIIHRTGKIAYSIDTYVHNIHIRYIHTEQDRNSCITCTIRNSYIIHTQQRMHGMVLYTLFTPGSLNVGKQAVTKQKFHQSIIPYYK